MPAVSSKALALRARRPFLKALHSPTGLSPAATKNRAWILSNGRYRSRVGSVIVNRHEIIEPKLCEKALAQVDLSAYKNACIIDMNPGLGLWSAALNKRLKPRQHTLLEPLPVFHDELEKMARKHKNMYLVKRDGYMWNTYGPLFNGPHTEPEFPPNFRPPDPKVVPPEEGVNTDLLFTGNLTLPSSAGDRLLAQFISCCASGAWVQQFGRVRFLVWVHERCKDRSVPQSVLFRSRTNVSQDAVCEVREVVTTVNPNMSKGFTSRAAIAKERNIKEYTEEARQMGIEAYNDVCALVDSKSGRPAPRAPAPAPALGPVTRSEEAVEAVRKGLKTPHQIAANASAANARAKSGSTVKVTRRTKQQREADTEAEAIKQELILKGELPEDPPKRPWTWREPPPPPPPPVDVAAMLVAERELFGSETERAAAERAVRLGKKTKQQTKADKAAQVIAAKEARRKKKKKALMIPRRTPEQIAADANAAHIRRRLRAIEREQKLETRRAAPRVIDRASALRFLEGKEHPAWFYDDEKKSDEKSSRKTAKKASKGDDNPTDNNPTDNNPTDNNPTENDPTENDRIGRRLSRLADEKLYTALKQLNTRPPLELERTPEQAAADKAIFDAYEARVTSVPNNDRSMMHKMIDETFAQLSNPPLLQYAAQTVPPIPIDPERHVYPPEPVGLIDFTPIVPHPFFRRATAAERMYVWNHFQYVIQNLFAVRAKSIADGLRMMAPGAENLLNDINPEIEPNKRIRVLTMDELTRIAEAWIVWPFRPKDVEFDVFEPSRRNEGGMGAPGPVS